MAKINWKHGLVLACFLLVCLNLLVLNLEVFEPLKDSSDLPEEPVTVVTEFNQESSPEKIPSQLGLQTEGNQACPQECLKIIGEATASKTISSAASVKEYYIPLGKGSTTSKTYEELNGVEAVVDMGNYPNVKSVIFEASLRIPTANGKAYAKLYSVTDQHDVWFSEVMADGSGEGYRAEANGIIMSSGRKLYRVKVKSSMGYEAILDSARIKIILE